MKTHIARLVALGWLGVCSIALAVADNSKDEPPLPSFPPPPPPPLSFFMQDTVLSPKGYFIVTAGRAQTDVISGIRRATSSLPKSKNFSCESDSAKLEKNVYEGNERDLFFYSLPGGQKAMLTMIDVQGDYSRAYRPKELNIIRVGGVPGIISLVVAKEGGEKSRWGVGWDVLGAAADLYVEDKSPPILSKDQVLKVAESIRCRRL
jgi:hypothetical protein